MDASIGPPTTRGAVVDSETAFFCVADGPAYVPKAITALRSVARFHPTSSYLVVGRFASDDTTLALLAEHGIDFVELDLSGVFADTVPDPEHPGVTWPSECFWWTAVPALLRRRGHRYCCSLDGDVLCVRPLAPAGQLLGPAAVAGVAKRNGRVNTGVLFFDTHRTDTLAADAVHTYRTARTCRHTTCAGFCRARGDQGLLHELERRTDLHVRRIDNAYNHMLPWSREAHHEANPSLPLDVPSSRLLHMLAKPWDAPPRRMALNPPTCEAYRLWWRLAREVWPDPAERTARFGREYRVVPGRRHLWRRVARDEVR